MKAIWSEEADLTFAEIVENIHHRFTEKEAIAFLEETFSVIDAIEKYPQLYPKMNLRGLKHVHRAVIHPHSTMFYEVGTNRIEILFFWNNRYDPAKLK